MAVSQSLSVTQSSQNVANNTTTVTIKLTSTQSGASYNEYSQTGKLYVAVNGGSYKQIKTFSYTLPKSTTKTILSTTYTFTHNADGSGSIKVKTSCPTTPGVGTITKTASLTPTKIPRTPSAPTSVTITAGNGNLVGLGDLVTINWSGATGVITSCDVQYSRGNTGWREWKAITNTTGSGSTTDSFTATDIDVNGAGNKVQYRVRAKNGTLASAWTESNVLTISGKMNIKANGSWQPGSTWININGTWKRAKCVWVNVDGTWKPA